jgi:FixJ family two-component response regulator
MPGIDGVELQNRLANLGLSIPTIFVTAYPNDEIRNRMLSAGAICFLYKPFDTQTLLRCIEDALKRGSRKTRS